MTTHENRKHTKSTAGKATIGKATIGKATIGKATIGKATIGKATIGKASIGKASTKNRAENKRPRILLVARESGTGSEAKFLLEQLFYTLVRNLENRQIDLPDFGNILEISDDPSLADAEMFRRPNMRAALIKGETVDVLLSLGSARKLNARGENNFIEVRRSGPS